MQGSGWLVADKDAPRPLPRCCHAQSQPVLLCFLPPTLCSCRAHVEGKLKAEIIQDPARYVSRDPEMAQTLLDQRQAGKALLLITNRRAA